MWVNLVGLFVGLSASGGWLFPFVHAVSVSMEALFTTGCVVLVYQFCLRQFGRERLEGLMTTAQITVSIAAVLAGQLLPQLMFRFDKVVAFSAKTWWISLFPPAWFAGFDDALSGSGVKSSWILAALAVLATGAVLLLAFGKLAGDYQSGLQQLSQSTSRRALKPGRRRFIDILVDVPPLSWWLRDSVARASFLLTAAYITRDRDVKLRLYPSMSPYLVLPIIFFTRSATASQSFSVQFGVVFTAAYLAVIPMMALTLLQYSAQWQASDIFRAAPMLGPASIIHGARRAVLCLVAFPIALAMGLIVFFLSHRDFSQLLFLLPGLILIPVFAMIPNLCGAGVLLSLPNEESRAAGRGLLMVGALFGSMALSALAFWARSAGFFQWFILAETALAAAAYLLMRRSINNAVWKSLD